MKLYAFPLAFIAALTLAFGQSAPQASKPKQKAGTISHAQASSKTPTKPKAKKQTRKIRKRVKLARKIHRRIRGHSPLVGSGYVPATGPSGGTIFGKGRHVLPHSHTPGDQGYWSYTIHSADIPGSVIVMQSADKADANFVMQAFWEPVTYAGNGSSANKIKFTADWVSADLNFAQEKDANGNPLPTWDWDLQKSAAGLGWANATSYWVMVIVKAMGPNKNAAGAFIYRFDVLP